MATSEMSPSPPLLDSNRIQMTDVYEAATKIGQEFQKVIDEYGSTSVSTVIPMVVSALEQLETVVEENEQLRVDHCKLVMKADKLKEEREARKKLMAEQEEMSGELQQKIRALEQAWEMNGSLQQELKLYKEGTSENGALGTLEAEKQKNAALVANIEELQSSLDRAREKLAERSSELANKDREISDLKTDVETLYKRLHEFNIGMEHDMLLSSKSVEVKEGTRRDDNEEVDRQTETLKRIDEPGQPESPSQAEQSDMTSDNPVTGPLSDIQSIVSSSPGDQKVEDSKPQFYKKDLLIVLEDRDKLRIQVGELQDELKQLKMKLTEMEERPLPARRYTFFSSPRPLKEANKESKVKEIMESLTVSMNLQNAEKTTI